MDILEFQGEHRWLSNFWPAKVTLDGVTYPSVEHAYQAAKTHPSEREPFRQCTAAQAKKLGREIPIRSGWDDKKVAVMRSLIEQKFAPGTELAKKLMATGEGRIVEGNHWGDTFWGVCRGKGQNLLGEILMERRAALMQPPVKLEILEHSSPTYSPRTYVNATSADLTVAFAVDFSTAGEKLTHKAAGDRYIGIPLSEDPIQAARVLYKALRDRAAHTLNVAGNGIYTLSRHGWTQERVNEHVHAVLAKVHEHWPLKHVRSGGQTGVDMAGVTAAYALGVDATALFPKGFVQRATDKVDRPMTVADIRLQIEEGAAKLSRRKAPATMAPERAAPLERRFHVDGSLPENGEVFVFGSNLAGRHGKGGALVAKEKFGAIYGQGVGRQGQSYAIPTKDGRPGTYPLTDPRATLPVDVIRRSVDEFIEYAKANPDEQFFVARVGCALAAHRNADMAPLFADAPANCSFPDTWKRWLEVRHDSNPSVVPEKQPEASSSRNVEQVALFDPPEPQPVSGNEPGSVRVVSKRQGGIRPEPGETVIDGDRKNPVFGNRHYLNDWKDPAERERVINKHLTEDFEPDVLAGGPIYQEMQRQAERVRQGEALAISCWCAPLRCHCDHIADGIRKLAMGVDLQAEVRASVAARKEGSAQEENRYTFFWGYLDPFSNAHHAEFKVDGRTFRSGDQFLMFRKAELFGDTETAEKIMAAKWPKECKTLGAQVKNFVESVWIEAREKIMLEGCRAKFAQNPALERALLATGDSVIVEASPHDHVWGAGLSADDPKIFDPANWPGLNLLGKTLNALRDELRADLELQQSRRSCCAP